MLQPDNSIYSASIKGDARACTCLELYRFKSWVLWTLVCDKPDWVQSTLEDSIFFRLPGLIGAVNRTVQF